MEQSTKLDYARCISTFFAIYIMNFNKFEGQQYVDGSDELTREFAHHYVGYQYLLKQLIELMFQFEEDEGVDVFDEWLELTLKKNKDGSMFLIFTTDAFDTRIVQKRFMEFKNYDITRRFLDNPDDLYSHDWQFARLAKLVEYKNEGNSLIIAIPPEKEFVQRSINMF